MPQIEAPIRMVRFLAEPVSAPVWPAGVRLCEFSDGDAPAVHGLMRLCYADGGGSVPGFGEWWTALVHDPEFDPALCFLACGADGKLAGAAQCWTGAFVKDLVVHPAWRRHGIGRALMLQVFAMFRQRAATSVALKVEPENRVALAFYRSLGMEVLP